MYEFISNNIIGVWFFIFVVLYVLSYLSERKK